MVNYWNLVESMFLSDASKAWNNIPDVLKTAKLSGQPRKKSGTCLIHAFILQISNFPL